MESNLCQASRAFAFAPQQRAIQLHPQGAYYVTFRGRRSPRGHRVRGCHAHRAGEGASGPLHTRNVPLLGLVRGIQHHPWHSPN